MRYRLILLGSALLASAAAGVGTPGQPPNLPAPTREGLPEGWSTKSPRKELAPDYGFDSKGGADGAGAFVIRSDREGQHGWFEKSFAITGGRHYRFDALRKAEGVAVPRKSVYARVLWRDDAGKPVKSDPPEGDASTGGVPTAEPEYPSDSPSKQPGHVAVSGTYRAP